MRARQKSPENKNKIGNLHSQTTDRVSGGFLFFRFWDREEIPHFFKVARPPGALAIRNCKKKKKKLTRAARSELGRDRLS